MHPTTFSLSSRWLLGPALCLACGGLATGPLEGSGAGVGVAGQAASGSGSGGAPAVGGSGTSLGGVGGGASGGVAGVAALGGTSGAAGAGSSTSGAAGLGGTSSGAGAGGAANAGAAGAGAGGARVEDGSCDAPYQLGSDTGRVATGIISPGRNGFDACPGNGAEHHLRWVAPQTGRYAFRTDDSDFDTVLFVQPGGVCSDPTGGLCSDDYFGLQSLVDLEVERGEALWLVLDSFGSQPGNYALDVQSVGACPGASVGPELPVSQVVASDFQSESALLALGGVSECGGGPLGFTLEFQAPREGRYRFSVAAPRGRYDPVIAVRQGCSGSLLACDDDGGETPRSAALESVLSEREVVLIEIGSFEVSATPRGGDGRVELWVEEL